MIEYGNVSLASIIFMNNPHPAALSEKQLNRIPFFKSVRHINGEKIFKELLRVAQLHSFQAYAPITNPSLLHSLIYVRQGELLLCKVHQQRPNDRTTLRSYRAEEYCGFHDSPLFWDERIEMQVAANTVLIAIPLDYFYRFFRRVIPMTSLQSRAEYLKRLPLFRGVELQKILRLASLSSKIRVEKGEVFMKEGEQIENVFIITSGKISLESSLFPQFILCGPTEDFLVKEVRERIDSCLFTATSIVETEMISLPKTQFRKIFDIRYELSDKGQQGELREETEYQTFEDERMVGLKAFKQPSLEHRTYHPRAKTEKSIDFSEPRNCFTRGATRPKRITSTQLQHSRTHYLGEIQRMKFTQRKERAESRNFFRYIESRAPEIVMNPWKEFALVKPVYKSQSQYVRNMKRKIKQSNSISLSGNYRSQNFID